MSDTTRLDETVRLQDLVDELRRTAETRGRVIDLLVAERDKARAERDAALAAVQPSPVNVERLCEVMHDAYERAAVVEGWDTNPESATAWAHVPEANKRTMRVAVSALLAARGTVGQGVCPHCESTGRCVGSCLDDPREDPNGE